MDSLRQKIEIFGPIPEEIWQQFKSHLKLISVPKGQVIQKANSKVEYAYFIRAGLLRFYYLKAGTEYIRQFFFEGGIIADLVGGMNRQPTPLYIDAVEESQLVKLPLDLLFRMPKLREKVLEDALFHVGNRMASIFLDSPEEKYLDLLKTRPKVMQRIPQYMIASYIGVTPEGLSRIKKRIADRERS